MRTCSSALELGVGARLTFAGAVPRDAMPALLAEHDVLVFPSINVEAYAAACSRPSPLACSS